MANRWTMLRDNLVAALKTLSFDRDVVVEKVAQPAGVNAIAAPIAIGVSRAGGRATMPSEIGSHIDQPADTTFQISIRTDSAMTTTAGLDDAEEVATIAMAVRNMDIGIYGQGKDLDTGGVYLDYLRDDVVEFKGREPGGAGPIVLVVTLRTTVIPI